MAGSHRETIDLYLDDTRIHPRLSAEQEREQLVRLTSLRRGRWVALLSLPSLQHAVLQRVRDELEELPTEAIAVVEQARARLAEEGSHQAAQALVRASAALGAELEAHDTEVKLAETLEQEVYVAGSEAARHSVIAEVAREVDADVFGRYRSRVRRAHRAWVHARNRFVCSNLRLVVMVANRYSDHWLSLADRVQEGNLGLIKAVDRFDPERGTRFSTYAVWWIRHAITRALVNRGRTVRVPAHLHVLFTKIRRLRTELERTLGRSPTVAELAEELDTPVAKVRSTIDAMALRSVALDAPVDDDEGLSLSDCLGAPPEQHGIDEGIDERRAATLALQALEQVDDRARDIVERRFALRGHPRMTLAALGERHEVSRERVRQIQNRTLRAIRREVESNPVSALAYA